MRQTTPAAWLARTMVPLMLATVVLSGQGTQKPTTPQTPQPVFTKAVNYFTTDLRARDAKGRFVPNLTKDDFEVYEDGVLQKVEVFYPVIGGRPINAPNVSTSPCRSIQMAIKLGMMKPTTVTSISLPANRTSSPRCVGPPER